MQRLFYVCNIMSHNFTIILIQLDADAVLVVVPVLVAEIDSGSLGVSSIVGRGSTSLPGALCEDIEVMLAVADEVLLDIVALY